MRFRRTLPVCSHAAYFNGQVNVGAFNAIFLPALPYVARRVVPKGTFLPWSVESFFFVKSFKNFKNF